MASKLVPSVDHGDRINDATKVITFVQGGIASADNHDVLPPEKVAVTNCTIGDASPGKTILAGYTQLVVGTA